MVFIGILNLKAKIVITISISGKNAKTKTFSSSLSGKMNGETNKILSNL